MQLPGLVLFTQAMAAGAVAIRRRLLLIAEEHTVPCFHALARCAGEQAVYLQLFITAQRNSAGSYHLPDGYRVEIYL